MTAATAPAALAAEVAGGESFRARLAELLVLAGVRGVAGGAAGLLALGVGSRVAMRLVALTSGRIGTGIRPESGAVPGQLTMGGTMFLLVAGTVFGVVLAVLVGALLARWLPRTGIPRMAVIAALTAVGPALALVDPGNQDFFLFGPRWFAVSVFLGCALGYGVLVAVLSRTSPPASRGWRIVCMVLGVGALVVTFFVLAATVSLPVSGPVVAILVAAALVPRDGRWGWWHGPGVQRGGAWVLAAGALAAAGVMVWRSVQTLLA